MNITSIPEMVAVKEMQSVLEMTDRFIISDQVS